jgi:hypothetical protein
VLVAFLVLNLFAAGGSQVGLDRWASRVGAVDFTSAVYHQPAEGPAVPP